MQSNKDDHYFSNSVISTSLPITRSDILEVVVRELIDEVIEEKITGEILLEIIAQNQVSKIADKNLILHRDAMAVAEQVF